MKEQHTIICKIEQPYTHNMMEIYSTIKNADIEKIKGVFSRANTIVDAQFYYTNPLMYVFVDEISPHYAKLYENYYLIPPKLYDSMEINDSYVAVNSKFIEKISSLSQLSENNIDMKPNKEPFMDAQDQLDSPTESLFNLHQAYGLYIIGIRRT